MNISSVNRMSFFIQFYDQVLHSGGSQVSCGPSGYLKFREGPGCTSVSPKATSALDQQFPEMELSIVPCHNNKLHCLLPPVGDAHVSIYTRTSLTILSVPQQRPAESAPFASEMLRLQVGAETFTSWNICQRFLCCCALSFCECHTALWPCDQARCNTPQTRSPAVVRLGHININTAGLNVKDKQLAPTVSFDSMKSALKIIFGNGVYSPPEGDSAFFTKHREAWTEFNLGAKPKNSCIGQIWEKN